MFQRIKGAIDRTIAEEQARQQKALEAGSPMARSASSASRAGEGGAGRRSRSKNPDAEAGDAAPNPDPAIFEAAFVIDDSDEPSRAGTPKPAPLRRMC
ncbi:Autophagy protein [Trichoderma asperellum]|uniref:Autophagy protein n=1 Tax=Trichoderma asperellum TaxID=101201 RepID=UPI0033215AF6|nr:Autophagy protein [Trichoderma asperellum]